LLSADGGSGERHPLDGKVISLSDLAGAGTALVRFTGLDANLGVLNARPAAPSRR
jgi:hypothetical protein